ncbi:hypothetical protein F5Y15DRAFT_425495 [Xylariaceae sp. FL0016]|nr:hypothetical protein F5Y15DRAFT_425495 [Xylariaceae sp. FL0016]
MSHQELAIEIAFRGNNRPLVFDLSGGVPFELCVIARRIPEDKTDSRDLTLQKADSIFDFPAALASGLVELVDEDTGKAISYHDNADQGQVPTSFHSDSFVTVPAGTHRLNSATQIVPLHVASHLRHLVSPEHKYHIRLRDKHLGVRWWTWVKPSGSPKEGDQLPPFEPETLISSRLARSKTFTVVAEIPMPPRLSISLASAEEPHSREGDGGTEAEVKPAPHIQITITNTNDQPIVLKTTGDQPHLRSPDETSDPRARVTNERPDVKNFSIIDQETQEDLISDAPLFTTPLAGGSGRGWPRKQFLELPPHERVVRLVKLPGNRLVSGKKYHVSLRPSGCWWTYGTLDVLFDEGNAVLKRWPSAMVAPMPLESEEVVVLNCH